MSEVQTANSFTSSENLIDQSNTETIAIVELADEQLEEVAGGALAETSEEPASPNLFGWQVPTPFNPKPKQQHGAQIAGDAIQAFSDGKGYSPLERVFARVFSFARIP